MLRFATYLAPILYDTYQAITCYVGEQLGITTTLGTGQSLHEFTEGRVDVGFTCGLPYALMVDRYKAKESGCPLELLAAPVLLGERYGDRPIYYSDVVVRSDSPYVSFDELQGCRWAYNQPESHSGWNLVCYSLIKCGKSLDFFGQLIQSGSHQRSLELVLAGQADAAAIDSHVLDVLLARDKSAAASLRVVDTLGPSSIPPVVVATTLEPDLKQHIQEVLLAIHEDIWAAGKLHEGGIARFVKVCDEGYDDLREMYRVVKQSGMLAS
jgi:phosphonate transport system substrate-binding protein